MSNGRKIMSILTLAIAIVAFNTFATAQDNSAGTEKGSVEKMDRRGRFGRDGRRGNNFGSRHGKRGMHGDRGLMRSLRQLNLTETQKSQIKLLTENQRTANEPLRTEAKALFMKKREGTISEGEQARLDEIGTQMKNSGEQLRNSVLALLTPEQTQQLQQMKAEREQKMQERRQLREQRRQQMKDMPTPEDGR